MNFDLSQIEKAQQTWKETPITHRAELFIKLSEYLKENKNNLGKIISQEMGKPILESLAEIEKCALGCEFYAKNSENFLKDEIIPTEASKSFISFQPLGIILAIMPWNFPFWQVFRFAAPALMAGNAIILKHASNVPDCSDAIEKCFRDCGFPKNIFKSFKINSQDALSLIENPLIQAITLTGSTPAGKAVAEKAGRFLKKCVLELGGSDPFVVLADANIDLAVDTAIRSRMQNAGQSCIAAKRFIVDLSIKNEFEEKLVHKVTSLILGDPLDIKTQIGPMAKFELREELHNQVMDSVKKGAQILCGGKLISGSLPFYPPTVLTNVVPGMRAFDEELFGPVAAVISAQDESEALSLANQTRFGLGATIFTNNIKKGEQIARNYFQAGCCFVNSQVKSDPRLPFGGIKESGYGRELSVFGIREFVNIKTVWIP